MIDFLEGAFDLPLIDAPELTVQEAFVVKVRNALPGRVATLECVSTPLLVFRKGNRTCDAGLSLKGKGRLSSVAVLRVYLTMIIIHRRNTVADRFFQNLPRERC